MTEDEAKTRWCPFVRIAPIVDAERAVTTRGDHVYEKSQSATLSCIASGCMAWRQSIQVLDMHLPRKEASKP